MLTGLWLRDIYFLNGNESFLFYVDFFLSSVTDNTFTGLNYMRQYPIKTNQTFLEIVADNGLEQIVDFPTGKDNTLDLMLLSHPAYKLRCKPLPSIGNSDHDIVLLDIQAKTSETQNISMEKSRYLQDKGRSRIIWKHISKHRKERY